MKKKIRLLININLPFYINSARFWNQFPLQTLSYSGHLDFLHYFESEDMTGPSPDRKLPLAVIIGNGFIIESGHNVSLEAKKPQALSVRLHEVEYCHQLESNLQLLLHCCYEVIILDPQPIIHGMLIQNRIWISLRVGVTFL